MARTFVLALASLFLLNATSAIAEDNYAAVSNLIQQLSSDDTQERREAAYELADLGPDAKEAVPALIKALDDRDTQVWAEATGALARIGPDAAAAVDELMSHLGSRDRQRWYRTAHALGKIGEPALARLRDALQSENLQLRAGSALALGWMGEAAAPAPEAAPAAAVQDDVPLQPTPQEPVKVEEGIKLEP